MEFAGAGHSLQADRPSDLSRKLPGENGYRVPVITPAVYKDCAQEHSTAGHET